MQEPSSFGSMLEISWRGSKPVAMNGGGERKFLQVGLILSQDQQLTILLGRRQCGNDWNMQRKRLQCGIWNCGGSCPSCNITVTVLRTQIFFFFIYHYDKVLVLMIKFSNKYYKDM